MRLFYKFLMVLIVLATQACQPPFKNKALKVTKPLSAKQFYSLIQQATIYQGYDRSQQQIECERLKQVFKTTGRWQIQWLLVYALNETFSCYNMEETLQVLVALDLAIEPDFPLHGLNKSQIKIYNELHKFQKKTKSLRWQLKSSQKKLKQANAKLEALKAIETSINKKLDEDNATQ